MLILGGLLAADWLAEIIWSGGGLIMIPRGRQTNIVNKIPGYQTPGYQIPGYQTPGYQDTRYQDTRIADTRIPGYQTPGYQDTNLKPVSSQPGGP